MRKNILFIGKLFLSICLLGTVSCEMRDELRHRMPGNTDKEAIGGSCRKCSRQLCYPDRECEWRGCS